VNVGRFLAKLGEVVDGPNDPLEALILGLEVLDEAGLRVTLGQLLDDASSPGGGGP
jgi:hypothetical protein